MSVYKSKATGRYIFEFDVRISGRRIRSRKVLPKAWTKAQADAYGRKEQDRLTAQVKLGEGHAFSIEDAVTAYLDGHCGTVKSGRSVRSEILLTFWAYKGKPLSALPEACREIAQKGRGALAPATVRNRICYLTTACRWAWKHAGMGESDPALGVTVPVVNNERHLYASRQQILRIARAYRRNPTHPGMWRECRAVLMIAFYSGMRLGEVLRARIDGPNFYLGTTKNGKPRVVPIHPRIKNFLWVYSGTMPGKSTVQKNFTKARNACGMQAFHFHDVRHSAASEMINNGVDLYTVGAVLGHRSARSTQRYAHLATETLAVAVGKIGKKVA